jgi:hypothetical protein
MDMQDALTGILGAAGGFLSAWIEKEFRTQRPLKRLQDEYMSRKECAIQHRALSEKFVVGESVHKERIDTLHRELKSDINDLKNMLHSQNSAIESQTATIIKILMRNGFRK